MVTNCIPSKTKLQPCGNRSVELSFSGGDISTNAGVLLLNRAERRLGILQDLSRRLTDGRQKGKVVHDMRTLLTQRVFSIALGHEDVNDHDDLRDDLALQTACNKGQRLASSSTVGRLERSADRKSAVAGHGAIVEAFIASYDHAPEEVTLDFDATDDLVHGNQEGRHFNKYYDNYCFLPLYVFCGDQLLVSYLRPASSDGAKHSWAILSLLVRRLRQAWPNVQIIFRGDAGFCRHKMMSWCERKQVKYIIGLGRNPVLERHSSVTMSIAKQAYEESGEKQRLFSRFNYAAKSWKRKRWIATFNHGVKSWKCEQQTILRKVIARMEYSERGPNPRYIVTNLKGDSKELYDNVYCQRGDMENRIKEQQLYLFADRTSCHEWWPNQFRLILASVAYTLIEGVRRLALKGTKMARAQAGTIRLRLFKIGAVITRNTRRVRLHLSSAYPDKELFLWVLQRL